MNRLFRKKMFNICAYLLLSITISSLFGGTVQAATPLPRCTSATTLATLLPSNECTLTPDTVILDVYQFALCTSEPLIDDVNNCDFLLNSTTATSLNLSAGSTGSLTGASLAELGQKDYTYVMLVIAKSVQFKTTFTFDTAQYGYDGVSGNSCRTNGQSNGFLTPLSSDNSITCGANPTPFLTEYHYPYFGAVGNYTASVCLSDKTNSYSLIQGPVPSTLAASSENGSHIQVSQLMPASLDLTAVDLANLNVNISFMVTDAAKLTFYQDPTAGTYCALADTPCAGNIEVNFLDVIVTSQ